MAKKKKKKNYINNKDLLAEVIKSKEQGKMTDEFGKMMLLLVKRYSSQGCYSGYTYVDDMEAYALMTVCKVWNSFNPEKSNNPFAYFTQTIKRAFWQYLHQEERHRDIRDEMLMQEGELPSHTYMDKYAENNFNNEYEESIKLKTITEGFETLLERLITQMVGKNKIQKQVLKTIKDEMFSYEFEKNDTPSKFITDRVNKICAEIDPTYKNISKEEYLEEMESYDENGDENEDE